MQDDPDAQEEMNRERMRQAMYEEKEIRRYVEADPNIKRHVEEHEKIRRKRFGSDDDVMMNRR